MLRKGGIGLEQPQRHWTRASGIFGGRKRHHTEHTLVHEQDLSQVREINKKCAEEDTTYSSAAWMLQSRRLD